jgi:hypothetical protein
MARRANVAAYLMFAALVGCGTNPPPIVEAEGIVLLNGAPLPKAKVRFFPQFDNASEHVAHGVTDDNGRFRLVCHGQPGACATLNIVTVADDDIPEHLTPEGARGKLQAYLKSLKNRPIPDIYGTAALTPLRVTVAADQKEYKIELKR